MARPQKRGLDYFPLDVDIDQDDKIQLVEALHGMTGFSVVIKLLMRIYKEGYYYEWGEMEQLLFSRRVNVDINTLDSIVNDCIKYGIFDVKIYEAYKVLTSVGIQERYFEATKRRKNVTVVNQYMLINDVKKVNVDIIEVNVDINGEIVDTLSAETPQSKVKESKEEESKQQETTEVQKAEEKVPEQKPVVVVDDGFAELTNFYAENIGPLNKAIGDELGYMCDALNSELALLALKESVLANAKNKIRYTNTILSSWKSQNFKTASDVEQHEKRTQQGKRNLPSGYKAYGSSREEFTPEWFGKEGRAKPVATISDIDIERERQQLLRELNAN